MTTEAPRTIHLKDYAQPAYWVDQIDLDFALDPDATRIKARIEFHRRDGVAASAPLVLDGEEIQPISVSLDGKVLGPDAYTADADGLVVHVVPAHFTLETEVEINPAANTALEGLYISGGIFATQCEAESFRRITYYLDRPDVMAPFRVRMTADKTTCPVLLSNGDPIAHGDNDDGTHWAEWRDPHKKPAYLFALVAGDLVPLRDSFTTCSGRNVDLGIWVREEDSDKCDYAMDALKRSMKWDEETFGREYDLDVFNIVAVNDFNFGAMENKGLNIFNSVVVLARPDTATDENYGRIESVVAHEYFHNWTGNRITCRDWFQICLKEGFTVYRDQAFTAAMREPNVARINDVLDLRARQFPEDAGPLAHPARPESYISINNFYTSTVYEKGSEIARMMRTLLGPEDFRKATDLYFARHDGEAATVEDFVKVMEDASGKELTQFRQWYSQAGTPHVTARGSWDEATGTYELTLTQETKPTPGQPDKKPQHIPVSMGFVGESGNALPLRLKGDNVEETPTSRVVELTEAHQTFRFSGVAERPVPSLFRGFSAPVRVDDGLSAADRRHLMAHDTDAFNRWDAGQAYARDLLLGRITATQNNQPTEEDVEFASAMRTILLDDSLDPAFKACAFLLPSEAVLGQAMSMSMNAIDPDAIHDARKGLLKSLAKRLQGELEQTYAALASKQAFAPTAEQAGKRALRNRCLAFLSCLETSATDDLVFEHFEQATNMTDEILALALLADLESPHRAKALSAFHDKWQHDALVTNKWFQVQATSSRKDTLAQVKELTLHPGFTLKNPNRARSLLGGFAFGNQLRFNDADGAAYAFFADEVLALDAINPMVSARMITAFENWRHFDDARKANARAALRRVLGLEGLSKNLFENASRILGED